MNIAIDIDDTLTDSFNYFQQYVAEFFGVGLDRRGMSKSGRRGGAPGTASGGDTNEGKERVNCQVKCCFFI